MLGPVEDFQRAGHVAQVELILEGNEDLDRLEVESIRFLNDCTCEERDGQRASLAKALHCVLQVDRLTHLWQLICLGNGICDGVGSVMKQKRRRVSSGWKKRSCGRFGLRS
jgi:hypothetical protein